MDDVQVRDKAGVYSGCGCEYLPRPSFVDFHKDWDNFSEQKVRCPDMVRVTQYWDQMFNLTMRLFSQRIINF